MNIIFQIEGGLGKSIMATAMVKVIKNHYKDSTLIVVTAYPDVFLNNPQIDKVKNVDNLQGLYLEYIKGKECKVFASEPYRDSDFILESPIPLLKTWCKIFDLTYNNEQPELFLTNPEIDYFTPFYKTEKPILAIQTNGGPVEQSYNYSWTRDIPESNVLDIINYFKKDYTIVHIKRENQKTYPDTLHALDNHRSIAILLQISKKRLLIDSFSQHLSAALNLKSTVCWITTKPEIFGYKLHDNIKSEIFTKEPILDNATYNPFALTEEIHSIPYNDLSEIFDTQKIISSINNQ